MMFKTDSRLAIAALLLSSLTVIFASELPIIAKVSVPKMFRMKEKRRRRVIMFRHLVAPVFIGLLGIILVPMVFVGKGGEISPTDNTTRCADAEVDGDVGGDGIRVAIWAQESVLLMIALLGTFHCAATGAKELGAGLAITHVSLAIALLVQAGRGMLTSADAIIGAMMLDSQGSALSVQLVAKETLAARWQVGIIAACHVFGLGVLATLVDRFSRGMYALEHCGCIEVFWWGWLSDCQAFASREMIVWWTYYASRCLAVVQCCFHSVINTSSFHKAEKSGTPLKAVTYPEIAVPKRPLAEEEAATRGEQEWSTFKNYPSTVTLMYTIYGVFALTSMASAEIAMRAFGLRPSSEVFSVGQVVALVVAGATILRAIWLFSIMFWGTKEHETGFVWPFSFDVAKRLTGFPREWRPRIASRPDMENPLLGGTSASDGREVVCGPLLNYRRMQGSRWHGSVLVVTRGGGRNRDFTPMLLLGKAGQLGKTAQTNDEEIDGLMNNINSSGTACVSGTCLYSDLRITFWAFDLAVDLGDAEAKWEYALLEMRFAKNCQPLAKYSFFVPSTTESMRIMFYSCNGFGQSFQEDDLSGVALWRDVLRRHAEAPFHVMIGGGDQIYNDAVRTHGPLKFWSHIAGPEKRRNFPFRSGVRDECDDFYLRNYIRWYATEPFGSAGCQIPQLNIWDDHDVINGYGSHVDEWMGCHVFRGLGSIAYKYYMLFQHHLPPPPSTYMTDDMTDTTPPRFDPEVGHRKQQQHLDRTKDVHVEPRRSEPNYIIGMRPGPYISENSYSIYARLGARIAFLGIDTRTERTRHQVNYPETYDAIFERLNSELAAASHSGTPIKHLLLLVGTPIAFPRLAWLERILASRLITPLKFLHRRFGIFRELFNPFDASVYVLDDLCSLYTSCAHKKERNALIVRLQTVAAAHSVRVTILSGDVHMATVGRFASDSLPGGAEHDHRFMLNVVSSAIASKPPPEAVATLLTWLNQVHYVDTETEETMLKVFDKEPGGMRSTAGRTWNRVVMPRRNYAVLAEKSSNSTNWEPEGSESRCERGKSRGGCADMRGRALQAGKGHAKAIDGELSVRILVEVDELDNEGRTESYGLTVPSLMYKPPFVLPKVQEKQVGET